MANFYDSGQGGANLNFYSSEAAYAGVHGGISSGGGGGGGIGSTGGRIEIQGWWNAFGTGGVEGEPPLLEELGVNFDHILAKSLTVLNPLTPVSPRIMDDADLAGPLVFYGVFAALLLVGGRFPAFSYIYGLALLGSASIYTLLNLMSEQGIDAYRCASVLGYCLLPMVLLSMVSLVVALDGSLGYVLAPLTILWCAYSASSIFASVLHLSHQRFLVGYPVALLYAAFALLSVW